MQKRFAAYIPFDRRYALSQNHELQDSAHGCALFADISGFTPLTVNLVTELGAQRGAEEILRQINKIFEALIAVLHRYQGSAINFAGDAVTCWLEGDDGRRAVACGLAMQEAMAALSEIRTPQGTLVSLGVKVAVASGRIRRFVVGDPDIQLIDVLAGRTLSAMAAAEKQARQGEVVITAEMAATLGADCLLTGWRVDHETGERYGVVQTLTTAVPTTGWPEIAFLGEEIGRLKQWLLPPILQRLRLSQRFLAELRPAVPLFIRFEGLDYDHDRLAGEKLDQYIRWVQRILGRYDGYLFQLTIGDKGSYLYTAFGVPNAHEDNEARAVAAALRLQASAKMFEFITQVQIGVSQGRVWSGAYGSSSRHTYGVIGNEINMAARLMEKARPNQVLVSSHVLQGAERQFTFNPLGRVTLRGVERPLTVAEAVGYRPTVTYMPTEMYGQPLVGRDDALMELQLALDHVQTGEGKIMRIEGGAGIGKSYLATTFASRAKEQGCQILMGVSQSTLQGVPYTPWRQIIRAMLKLEESFDEATSTARVAEFLADDEEKWLLRVPLLGSLLGVTMKEHPSTAALEPALRREALFALVVELIRTVAAANPLLLILEDVHWMDEGSQDLVLALGRALPHMPVLLLLVQRPPVEPGEPHLQELTRLQYHQQLALDELAPAGIDALVRHRVGGEVAPLALALIREKSHGNPFFAEELVDSLLEQGNLHPNEQGVYDLTAAVKQLFYQAGVVKHMNGGDDLRFTDDGRLAAIALDIPDSVYGIVLSRIDRLPEKLKLTLKVASVIGRLFELDLLAAAHPHQLERVELRQQVENFMDHEFVHQELVGVEGERASQTTYAFKHNITQEVVYGTLLFSQRRRLHTAIGQWYEGQMGRETAGLEELTLESPLAPHYPLLAHHWKMAEDQRRERLYATLAGRQATAQYANEDAVRYFSRALELTPEHLLEIRYDLLLEREGVYNWQGKRTEQAADLAALEQLTRQLNSPARQLQVNLRWAGYYRAIGQFDEALQVLDQELPLAETATELKAERAYLRGLTYRQQGEYQQARAELQMALQLAESNGYRRIAADSLLQIGNIDYYTNQLSAALERYQACLQIHQAADDLKGQTGCYMMIAIVEEENGEFAAALENYEQALTTCRKIGYSFGETQILTNLGTLYLNMGDFEQAAAYQNASLELCRMMDDREGESFCFCNLVLIYYQLQQYEQAKLVATQALEVQLEIGDRRNEGYTVTYLAHVFTAEGAVTEAEMAYRRALAIREELGEEALQVDLWAGLAEVARLKGELSEARRYVAKVLNWIDQHGTEGTEYPIQIYSRCYAALQTSRDEKEREKAQRVLATAHTLLQAQAAQIKDETLREKFLYEVPFNQQIMNAWELRSDD